MTELFLLHANKTKRTKCGMVWAKGKLRVPLTSAVSFQAISSPSTMWDITFQIKSSNSRLRMGRKGGYSQKKVLKSGWDRNLGFRSTSDMMPFVSAKLINFLLAKLTCSSLLILFLWLLRQLVCGLLASQKFYCMRSRCTSRIFVLWFLFL